ncbi:unknown [Singapore grouper iridovirus]|uniref:Ig-like domain-containing protein n=1 Tax=Singapore grouper iridovirus TaxID=262968 RepID=Q5YFM8_9VIRU|nr:hypothetical protein ORF037L [Singapore grouper iridovirus]AAS18052.1 unknown [Singapore grouper iridovirus]WAU86746.1 hypothetical protein ORF037L [Singapore grouper iridovirus]
MFINVVAIDIRSTSEVGLLTAQAMAVFLALVLFAPAVTAQCFSGSACDIFCSLNEGDVYFTPLGGVSRVAYSSATKIMSDSRYEIVNDTLRVTNASVKDSGEYTCSYSNASMRYVVRVKHSVTRVTITKKCNVLTCVGETHFAPSLSWNSMVAGGSVVNKTADGKFTVTSSVTTADGVDYEYTCSVSTTYGQKSVTYAAAAVKTGDSIVVLECHREPAAHTAVWVYESNQTIGSVIGSSATVQTAWKRVVYIDSDAVLTVTAVKNDKTYTCVSISDEHTTIYNFKVKIASFDATTGMLLMLLASVAVAAVCVCRYIKVRKRGKHYNVRKMERLRILANREFY